MLSGRCTSGSLATHRDMVSAMPSDRLRSLAPYVKLRIIARIAPRPRSGDIALDSCHHFGYEAVLDLAHQGRQPATPADRSECGARGRRLVTPAPGRLGHHACRHYDRRARCIAINGAGAGGGNPPLSGAKSREAWPELSLRDARVPLARAVVERRQACAPRFAQRRNASCGGCYSASFGVPLPFFCFLSFRSPGERQRNSGTALEPNPSSPDVASLIRATVQSVIVIAPKTTAGAI